MAALIRAGGIWSFAFPIGHGVREWDYLSLRLSYVPHNNCCIYSYQLVAWVGGVIRIKSDPEQVLGDCEMNLGNGR
jgi:hypothetical protein